MDRMTAAGRRLPAGRGRGARRLPRHRLDRGLRGAGTDHRGVRRRARRPAAADPALPAEGARGAVGRRAAGLGGRSGLRPRLPPAPHRAAGTGRGPRAGRADGPGDVRAPGPEPAAVGVLAGRGPGRRPVGADLQGAPLHGRRRLRHRPLPRRPRRDTRAARAGRRRLARRGPSRRTCARGHRRDDLARLPLASVRALAGAVRSPATVAHQARGAVRGLGALGDRAACRPRRSSLSGPLSARAPVRRRPGLGGRRRRGPARARRARSTTWCSPR